MLETKQLGNKGEEAVVTWLQRDGFDILSRNYQTRLGEVDVIAAKDEYIVFVEVKTRNTQYFPISQTVTYGKQQRIIKAARNFILVKQLDRKSTRLNSSHIQKSRMPSSA